MANVAAPRNGIPIGTARIGGQAVPVEVHPEYLRWFDSLVFRLGGATGASSTDLALSSFEDAGIEESKLDVIRLSDDAGQLPPQQLHPGNDDAGQVPPTVIPQFDDGAWQLLPPQQAQRVDDDVLPAMDELRAQIAELQKAVKALQQGITA